MTSSSSRPNIVFILADDMGYGDFGRFNGRYDTTPALDGLIDEGVCLTQHYSASCVCSPARAALMTGRYPHRTGAVEMREARGFCNLAAREITIADLLKPLGYTTGCVGKWHNGSIGRAFHPQARGFDEFVGFRGGGMDYWKWMIERAGRCERTDGRYLTDVFTEAAVDFIERHQAEPFFLYVPYNAPHGPHEAPEEDIARFRCDELTEGVSALYGMVRRLDAGLAAILETLKRCGLEDNTLVIFTSDNGPAMGGQMTRFNCNFNGSKGNVYEGGVRLPLIARWPAGLDGGRQLDQMTHLCDWLPTLAAATGAEAPADRTIDGVNLLDLLQGRPQEIPTQRFWQWTRDEPVGDSNSAMRDGDWKLVRPVLDGSCSTRREEMKSDWDMHFTPWDDHQPDRRPAPPRELPEAGPAQLFNLSDDPGETNDLAAAEPGRVKRMLTELENWFEDGMADRASIGGPWTGLESPLWRPESPSD